MLLRKADEALRSTAQRRPCELDARERDARSDLTSHASTVG
jgi:hypothetical protein